MKSWGIALTLSLFAAGSMTMVAGEVNAGKSVMNEGGIQSAEMRQKTKIEKFLDSRIPVGFYTYLYAWRENTDPTAHDLDDAIEEMSKRGFNYLYVGGTRDTPLWGKLLELCEKHHIAVVPQLDFAYLGDPKANVKALVARAVPFIKKYKDRPALMAFSVCEEPSADHMEPLKQYYAAILRDVPDAPLHLVYNYLPPLEKMEPPYPGIIGTDRYAFWWEMSGDRATPWSALRWYHSQLDLYYQLAAVRGADFQAVFTASTLEKFASMESIENSFYGKKAGMPGAKEQFGRIVQELATNKNLGWDKGPKGVLRYWKYYRPPVNCVRAMCWLAIMEGARSVANWSWSPPGEMEDFAYRVNGKTGREYINSILGWDGRGTPQLEEYTEFAGQIQRYSKLIRAMSKECMSFDWNNLPLGHQVATNTESPKAIFDVEGEDVSWRLFRVPGYSGKVVVMVNSGVGSWCEGRSPHFLSPKDIYRIDDLGNAVDYVPLKDLRKLKCLIMPDGMECVDLSTGEIITATSAKALTVLVAPGGGRFLFLCPKGSQEWMRLKKQFEL